MSTPSISTILHATMCYSVDKYIWSACIFPFLHARDVQRFLWINKNCVCHASTPLDWKLLLLNDTQYIRKTTRYALLCEYRQKTLAIPQIISIYTHPTAIRVSDGTTNMHELGFYHSTFQSRGICWSTNHTIHWHDVFMKTISTRSFDWLQFPPWELESQNLFTMFLPSEHRNVPPYITSMVGEPEDTLALTNYQRLYRFNMQKDSVYSELILGGRFESSITHMQLLAYVHPYVVVTGQPLWYNASSYYKCFGIWNVDTRESVLEKVITSCTPFPPASQARCGIPSVVDYLHHDCMYLSDCGHWLYWKFQHTLCILHLPTYKVTCKTSYFAFLYGRITRLVICTVKQWIAVYDADMDVWKLFDLPTGKTLIYVFKKQHKTQLHIHAFQSYFRFSRKIGAKVIVSKLPFEHTNENES